MKVRRQKPARRAVIHMVMGLVMASMSLLAAELWELQVKRQDGFETVARNQSVRRVRLPAVRGKIHDAYGICLADSVPNYCLAIYTSELRAPRSAVANVLELLHEVWARVGVPPDITYTDVVRHINMTPNKPLTAYRELDDDRLVRWRQRFEEWTAPPPGSFRHRGIVGLDMGRPVEGRSIVLHTGELLRRRTSPAANTLELVYKISERIGLPRAISFQDIKNHIHARRPLPLLAWRNLDDTTLAKWANTSSTLAGTDIYCMPARTYPAGETLAHLLGYTLTAGAEADAAGDEHIHFDLRSLRGRKGIEHIYDELLAGEPGYQLVQIDAAGFHHRNLQVTAPKPGGDLQLTIDVHMQRFSTEALAMKQKAEAPGAVRGAVVVLDPNNGDVMALVSSPTFDPNTYMQSKHYRQMLQQDETARMFQRAIYGQYPPGSTFKPIAALGALRADPGYAGTMHTCRKPYRAANRRMRCWIHSQGGTHGTINLIDALKHSCNVYMFDMAQAVGYEPIYAMARAFGLGQYAGIFPKLGKPPLPRDVAYGNLPQKASNPIDLCNLAIGQGELLASPLQMAMAVAAIANGGTLYRPRLVKRFRYHPNDPYATNSTWVIRRMDLQIAALETVRQGLRNAVMHPAGSARQAQVDGIEIAGKSGSAQYRRKIGDKVVDGVHAWMISYAPYDFPRYAVAMVVENGVSGGQTVGPRLAALYQKLFEYDGVLKKGRGRQDVRL